ncbi:hypothetical protein GCM10009433_14980 [Psychroflexus lacisalsi]|uniref:Uncharacterized protein n=1 Tax=Psychroflexus lacisalsi TaxID=503928 RepID=A0ABP3VHW8_9FLAO
MYPVFKRKTTDKIRVKNGNNFLLKFDTSIFKIRPLTKNKMINIKYPITINNMEGLR